MKTSEKFLTEVGLLVERLNLVSTVSTTQPEANLVMSSTFQLPKIGIQEIDEQHAQLVACLDRLELWVGKGQGFAAALDALTSLNDYVEKHFAFEEELLRRHGYQKLDEHIERHRQISTELARLTRQVLDGGDIDDDLLDLIRKWIITHIGVEDVEYATAFAKPVP